MDCWYCAQRKVDILWTKLDAAIREYSLLYCYTLTVKPKRGESREDLVDVAMHALKLLKARFKRKFKRPMPYIAVKSIGSRGKKVHLHVLTDTKLTYEWVKDTWLKHARAYNVTRRLNMWDDVPKLTNYMVNNWLEGYVNGLRKKKITRSDGIDIALKPKRPKGQRADCRRVNLSTRAVAKLVHGGSDWDYPENPRDVIIPPKNPERSEGIPPQPSDTGRRGDAGAAGDGIGTRGISELCGARLPVISTPHLEGY